MKIKEEYFGEMRDWVLEQVMEAGVNEIPVYRTIEVKVRDYLTKDDIKKIEIYIKALEEQYKEIK